MHTGMLWANPSEHTPQNEIGGEAFPGSSVTLFSDGANETQWTDGDSQANPIVPSTLASMRFAPARLVREKSNDTNSKSCYTSYSIFIYLPKCISWNLLALLCVSTPN
jgi:hypothetical protein